MDDTTDNSIDAGISEVEAKLGTVEAELDALRSQLAEAHRLATVGTISAVIAHEFNNLLTPIVSYSQLALKAIEDGRADEALIRKALTKSQQHAQRAGRICESLLNLVRGQGEPLGRVSVAKLVEEALSVLARDPQKDGIALRVQVPPEVCVRGDAVQLEQVLLNLLINARQALLAGGRVRGASITVRATEVDAKTIRLTIADNGPGIDPENLGRLFEPFFTTKRRVKGAPGGTGLGLHICRSIIERHRGRIDVESSPGAGAAFHVLLPAA